MEAVKRLRTYCRPQADTELTDPNLAAELKKRRNFRSFSYRGIELEKLLDLPNEEAS